MALLTSLSDLSKFRDTLTAGKEHEKIRRPTRQRGRRVAVETSKDKPRIDWSDDENEKLLAEFEKRHKVMNPPAIQLQQKGIKPVTQENDATTLAATTAPLGAPGAAAAPLVEGDAPVIGNTPVHTQEGNLPSTIITAEISESAIANVQANKANYTTIVSAVEPFGAAIAQEATLDNEKRDYYRQEQRDIQSEQQERYKRTPVSERPLSDAVVMWQDKYKNLFTRGRDDLVIHDNFQGLRSALDGKYAIFIDGYFLYTYFLRTKNRIRYAGITADDLCANPAYYYLLYHEGNDRISNFLNTQIIPNRKILPYLDGIRGGQLGKPVSNIISNATFQRLVPKMICDMLSLLYAEDEDTSEINDVVLLSNNSALTHAIKTLQRHDVSVHLGLCEYMVAAEVMLTSSTSVFPVSSYLEFISTY